MSNTVTHALAHAIADPDEIAVKIAKREDLPRLVAFLSRPSIDHSFNKPLSQREISISQRVFTKFRAGHWLFAQQAGSLLACVAVVPDGDESKIYLSTLALERTEAGKRAAWLVGRQALGIGRIRYGAKKVVTDSWEGNERFARHLTGLGFIQVDAYLDPAKRPPGIRTVVYELELA